MTIATQTRAGAEIMFLTWYPPRPNHRYPLKKVQDYVKLRGPFVLNDLGMQMKLLDRREIYRYDLCCHCHDHISRPLRRT
jgi:hypothetical protein